MKNRNQKLEQLKRHRVHLRRESAGNRPAGYAEIGTRDEKKEISLLVWRLEGLQQAFSQRERGEGEEDKREKLRREKEVRSESHHFCGENAVRAPTHVRARLFTIVTLFRASNCPARGWGYLCHFGELARSMPGGGGCLVLL